MVNHECFVVLSCHVSVGTEEYHEKPQEASGQLHAPDALSEGKQPPVPIEYKVGWAPEPVCTF